VTLYTHSPGVVLFYLELFHTTGDQRFLMEALEGADDLATRLQSDGDVSAGLYSGLAGLAFVMEEAHRASGRPVYSDHVERCLQILRESMVSLGSGGAWTVTMGDGQLREVNDIISGTAGTGLGLLYIADRCGSSVAHEMAIRAGHRLVELGASVPGGRRWEMWSGYPQEMPNFSHGTAGVSYFLAALHAVAPDPAFLQAAQDGAAYLQSIATGGSDAYRVFHHRPGGEDLYYLSWCHGPVGTSRLFHQLQRITTDRKWTEWVHAGARGIMDSGIPEVRTPGFWNNISQCCGTAGAGEFFLSLYRLTGDSAYRDFIRRLTDDLFERSSVDGAGRRWVQAEHRVRPELLIAQTGFMQGAAGVGTFLLHLDALERGEQPGIIFPDSPFDA